MRLRKPLCGLLPGLLTLFVVASLAPAVKGQVAKLQPVDEAVKDPSFFVFRARLLKALQKKDAVYLLSIIDPQIGH